MTAKDLFTQTFMEKLYCLADSGATLVQVYSVNEESGSVDLWLKRGCGLTECFAIRFDDFVVHQDYLFISVMKVWGGSDVLQDMVFQFFENEPLTLK